MDWRSSYKCGWKLYRVDPRTWLDGREVDGLMSASIDRDCTDDVPLLESGSFEVDLGGGPFESGWHRLVMVTDQGGVVERWPIATMLLESDETSRDKKAAIARVTGRSVLQPAADALIATGTYAPKGSNGAAYAASLLEECTVAPVTVSGGFTLDNHYVFEPGSSYLQCAWSLLDAANWCMRISGDGAISVQPRPSEPSLVLNRDNSRILQPASSSEAAWSGVKNRYIAVDGEEVATAVNDDPSSPASVQARGRYVDELDQSPTRVDGETLDAYARRRLEEISTVTESCSYTREYVHGAVPFDIVRAVIPGLGMTGDMRVLSQKLTCGKGISVEEKAGVEVRGYSWR